jgi:hypothetical protein
MNIRFLTLMAAFVALLCVPAAHAQLELRGGTLNLLDKRKASGAVGRIGVNGEVKDFVVFNGGAGYDNESLPWVTIAPPPEGGRQATAEARVRPVGNLYRILLLDGGKGYDSNNPPAVVIAAPEVPLDKKSVDGKEVPFLINTQFAGLAATSATSSAMFPTPKVAPDAETAVGRYPRAFFIKNSAAETTTVTLQSSTLGFPFALGIPSYSMGDTIKRPLVDASDKAVGINYWRSKPLEAGEKINGESEAQLPLGLVRVTNCSTSTSEVTVMNSFTYPSAIGVGARLLGREVQLIQDNGTTLTLSGPADENIDDDNGKEKKFIPYERYYYSKHADKVFATQPGKVKVTWVSALPDNSGGGPATYKTRTETFGVASSSKAPPRVIYWTQTPFKGPPVRIPEGRIVRVNPVFNTAVPGQAPEYSAPGATTNPNQGAAEPRTLWFEDKYGVPALHAHNVEGRLFVEYLGAGDEFLGADIVEIRRSAKSETIETLIGEQLRPRQGPKQVGDDQLTATVNLFSVAGRPLYGLSTRADGGIVYYAERANANPDLMTLFWSAKFDASLYSKAGDSVASLDISWPVAKRNYLHVWPSDLASYTPVNVRPDPDNDWPAVGPKFAATSLPELIYQDDPEEMEALIDPQNQSLTINFQNSSDLTNRSLLKFPSSAGPQYLRLYIQSESKMGSPAVSPEGGTPGSEAVYTLNDLDGDGERDYRKQEATVGSRIERLDSSYAIAGRITFGTCYSELAYINPEGAEDFEGAAKGAIIPVNALDSNDELTVWWYKKIEFPANTKIEPFHVPAIAANYKVSWPEDPQELVIASLKGLETPALTSVQGAGSLYVQNDPDKIGYNPNEEHALMLAGNVYALRDDLNDEASSSKAFVMIQYDGSDERPSMRVAKVLTETANYSLKYSKTAGTPMVRPLPLGLLPVPRKPDGTLANKEVEVAPDGLSATYLSWTDGASNLSDQLREEIAEERIAKAKRFTMADRKGQHWLIRGAHDGVATPSFGMQYYYYVQDGFAFPGKPNPPIVGAVEPFIRDAKTVTYLPVWPVDGVPELLNAQTLTLPRSSSTGGNLPQVMGQSSAQIIYQQSILIANPDSPSVALHDPIAAKMSLLSADGGVRLAKLPGSVKTTDYAGKTYFQGLPPNLQNRFYFDPNQGEFGGLVLIGEFVDVEVGEDYLNLTQLTDQDIKDLKKLCAASDWPDKQKWDHAIEALSLSMVTFQEDPKVPGTYIAIPPHTWGGTSPDNTMPSSTPLKKWARDLADVSDPDTAVVDYALSSTGSGFGYVTLMFGNGKAFTDPGDPVTMEIIKVIPQLFPGDLKVLLSSNPLDEKVTLRHSGDYGGHPENYEFRWRYGFATDAGAPPASKISTGSDWINPDPTDQLGNTILVGSDPTAVLSDPAVLMGDVYFTMSYRLKETATQHAPPWSDWTNPALVEGWIKRVLAKITPFNQRMTNLYSNSLNTDVSLLTQAGSRWEGNIALNLENVNDAGLIEIYETVLNRGKDFTINSDVDTASTSNALILAAGYLNDLYTILGHEAFADAANPTISIDDQGSALEVNTSRFAFEGQVTSSLDEELALLRGRDDFASPGTNLAPAYNRLWWNYTRGINSGEALYAVNYNIKEKVGSSSDNGIVDAADAYRMFPQAHGDAYGHYLTALKGYYKLLTHPFFTWTPSAEAVNILGAPVNVDYKDERKFAAAAANVGRTAHVVLSLERRRSYQDDPNAGWKHLRDGKKNSSDEARYFGVDETASRATQGAFFHWITGNALLPDVDLNPDHTGVQIVDRTTVPELMELPALANSFQTTVDSANARLNPLGLSPGAIAFDLDPYFNNSLGQELSGVEAGASHYEQISARALGALNNAAGSFNQAATMTRLLRNQENQTSDLQQAVVDEERALRHELIAIYGKPYTGDVGPGKSYPQGYDDPDFNRWQIIDRPLDWIDTAKPVTVTVKMLRPTRLSEFTGLAIDKIITSYKDDTVEKTFQVTPNQWAQFADVVGPGTALGKRPYVGALQEALVEAQLAQMELIAANNDFLNLKYRFDREKEVFKGLVSMHTGQQSTTATIGTLLVANATAVAVLESVAESLDKSADLLQESVDNIKEAMPKVVGLANDVTSVGRSAVGAVATATTIPLKISSAATAAIARQLQATVGGGLELIKENVLMSLGFSQDQLQAAYEFEQTYRELIGMAASFSELSYQYSTAIQKIRNLLVDGETVKQRRESVRKKAAGVINGYRTQDLTFRTFRNEALVQYRTLFDLASRYSYLAAKSYDYETGLLGTPEGQAVINRIVSSRSLGDLTDGVPQATTSTLGDAGLAGTMAQLNADFSVAEGRLGINNPDHYNTLFSLRQELFRILPHVEDEDKSKEELASDKDWQQTLEQHIVPNVLADPQVAAYCRGLKKTDGSATPGFIIPFSTTIEDGKNFFGLPLAAGDHAYSQSNFATKIAAVGVALPGYVGTVDGDSTEPNGLSATPYAYLIPCGIDYMRTPLGDTGEIRSWQVVDQALPLPYNLGASDFNTTQFFGANDTLREQPWAIRKHQAFRMVAEPTPFLGNELPTVYTNARLIGRSVWNSRWKIVIPAVTLLNDEQTGLNNFAASVADIRLFLRTYSNSGN